MKSKCPGQESRNRPIEAVNVTCPSCGKPVEMFSDEARRRCSCGQEVTRKSLPRCAEWCSAAAECFGEATDVRVLKARADQVKNDPRAAECLKTIQELLAKRNRKRDAGK